MSAHDAVTAVLVWLAIGSFVWMTLLCTGVIQLVTVWRLRSRPALVLASVYVIVAWPAVGYALCKRFSKGARR